MSERGSRKNPVASGIRRYAGGNNLGDVLSHGFVADITVETKIVNPLKPLREDMLDHTADAAEYGERFVFDGTGFVITIPVLDGMTIVLLDTSDRNWGRNEVLGKILSQTLAPRRDFTLIDECDEAFWVGSPGSINVVFDSGIGDVLSEHGQEVVLPFFMKYLEGDIRDRLPVALRCESAPSGQDV